jgi:hypothetical protein
MAPAEDIVMARRVFEADAEYIRLPRPPEPKVIPGHFVMCPLAGLPGQSPQLWCLQQWLYQQAFLLAQAVARPSILERDLLAVWN